MLLLLLLLDPGITGGCCRLLTGHAVRMLTGRLRCRLGRQDVGRPQLQVLYGFLLCGSRCAQQLPGSFLWRPILLRAALQHRISCGRRLRLCRDRDWRLVRLLVREQLPAQSTVCISCCNRLLTQNVMHSECNLWRIALEAVYTQHRSHYRYPIARQERH